MRYILWEKTGDTMTIKEWVKLLVEVVATVVLKKL